jgi:ssRNA-specific RNase YbeY (16S rRNA maturation enzyme)
MPRALGDVVLCPDVVGDEWRWPLTHGLLHLLGYDHGDDMAAREHAYLQLSVGPAEPRPVAEAPASPGLERER